MDQKPLILIVDDDRNIRDPMSDVLTEKGYEVLTACNGKEALGHIEQKHKKPDVIILDMNMPVMGGIEFYSKICSTNNVPQFPVLVLTGRAALAGLFKDFIIQGFVTKPFDFDKLIAEIEHIVHAQNVERKVKSNKMIIVDDDPKAVDLLMASFDRAGYETIGILSGAGAIVRIFEKPEGVVLIKLGMKDLPGDVIASRLHYMRKTLHLPVFLYVHRTDDLQRTVIEHFKEKNGIVDVIVFDEYKDIFETVDQRIKDGV